MKIDRKIILAGTGLLFVGTAMAQVQQNDSTLNRTVVVENQYNPEVMDAFKVNVLPKVEEPAVAKQHIDYATTQYPMTRFGFEPMGVMTREVKQAGARRGYLRGSYGMLNHTDVKAAYLWNMSKRDQLGVMGSFYGHSGDVEYPSSGVGTDQKDAYEANQRFFRTDVSLNYMHTGKKVNFNLGGNFGSQVFNYRSSNFMLDPISADSDGGQRESASRNQHFMMGEGFIGFSSVKDQLPVEFAVQVGFKGFKRMHPIGKLMDEVSEKDIYAKGLVAGSLGENQVGLGFAVNHVLYGGQDETVTADANNPITTEDFTLVQLNPYYAIQNENINIRLGAHVDFQTKVGSGLKVSPDVKIAYTFGDSYVLYAQALGGTQLNNFHQLNEITPYFFAPQQMKATYTVFDAQAGLKASPVNGLGMKLYGGYRLTKDDIFVLPLDCGIENWGVFAQLNQEKSKVFYAGLGVDYDYRDAFSFGIKGQYNNWKLGNKDNINFLALKPEFTIGANIRFKVYEGINVLADYAYEKRKEVSGKSLDAVNFLKLGAEYNYNDRLNVFVHANNLLDQSYITETGYPELGLNVVGGVSFSF